MMWCGFFIIHFVQVDLRVNVRLYTFDFLAKIAVAEVKR